MKELFKKIIIILLLSLSLTAFADDENEFTRYRSVDIATFKEYGFKMTREFFILKNSHEVDDKLSISSLSRLNSLTRSSINYLPDDITNEAYYNDLLSSIARAKKNLDSDASFNDVTKKLSTYLTKMNLSSIQGDVTVIPSEGNAPLIVTLKANVIDPEGTLIPKSNYVWWIDLGGRKKILGNGPSINYTFKDQGKYSVFVDVRSNHKNKKGYTDVLSYRGKADINVLSKIASVIVKVNGEILGNKEELKFTPGDARYGLVFDATSTVPTGKAKIIRTSWDFGNGLKREYNRGPRVERISYYKEGTYKVSLEMETNLGDLIKKDFTLYINDPIATINVKPLDGYLGDKFTFSAKTAANDDELTYNWEIVDIVDDKVIFKKQAKVFTYNFPKKGYFNVRLKVNLAYAQSDDIDSKVIYISSRAPEVNFKTSIPQTDKPNRVLFDATDTFDPDYTDNGKLKYSWLIDGEKIKLEKANREGSVGYYTFNSIGDHNVTLEVTDPDNVKGLRTSKVKINSILAVDFSSSPRVIRRGESIRFVAKSKEAVIYEWSFGDGKVMGGEDGTVSHTFSKSGKFEVVLSVEDANGNKNNYSQAVYVGDGISPVAILDVFSGSMGTPPIEKGACNGKDAYIVSRIDNVKFDAGDSIDVSGENNGLDYSIKIGNDKYFRARQVSYKFDELTCFPIKLTVTSRKAKTTDFKEVWVKVENLKPVLSTVSVSIANPNSDPIIIDVSAIGAKDKDGVVTSYLWYYYTDIDPEPQDFRVTTNPKTKFVLPKITGNYYFVVVLSDDNGERISSEELGKQASITLAGDNVNVPLANLSVNDNSVYIGEDVIFTAKVKNILGRNITSKCKYYWDFDGDGFYDQESSTNTVSHVYKKSGIYYAKLKIKHKGFSNTRLVEINVANRLSPDFKYISIGNTFLFLSTSKGSYSSIIWDLGDGKKVQGKDEVKHIYTDGKTSHKVTLKLIEGTKIKTKEYKVVKNMKNFLKTRKSSFAVLSYPENIDNEITLKEEMDYIYIYPSIKNVDTVLLAVDTDLETDSDLNGGKDDDLDVKSKSQDILKVKLNKNRVQKIAVFAKDSDDIVIDSKILTITKEYIEISNSDISNIKFLNVTDIQKKKIEYLKEQIGQMPAENKLKSMMYLQKLQEEWGDDTEKTKVILEFEGYLDETNLDNKDDLINQLEDLLVDNQEDKSEKNIAYNALRNLIPNKILCSGTGSITQEQKTNSEFSACKIFLIEKLDAIKVSDNVELNREIAKEILAEIVKNDKLTNNDKLDFRAILSTFVYGGVKHIPENEKEKVEKETEQNIEKTNDFNFTSILKKVIYIIFIVILVLLFITGLFFIYYKIANKDKDVLFSDFILKKTKSDYVDNTDKESSEDNILGNDKLSFEDEKVDVLGNIETIENKEEKIEKVDTSKETIPDWLKGVESDIENKTEVKQEKEDMLENVVDKKEENSDIKTIKEDKNMPDWLSGKTDDKEDEKKEDTNKKTDDKEENKQGDVPDWLKGSLDDKEDTTEKKEVITEEKQEKSNDKKDDSKKSDVVNKKKDTKEKDIDLEKETSLENEQSDIPDWLKGSLDEKETTTEKKQEKPVNEKESNSKQGDIPDWLKSSLEDTKSDKKEEKEEKKDKEEKHAEKEEKIKDEVSEDKSEKQSTKKTRKPRKTKQKDDEEKEVKTEKKEEKIETKEEKPKKSRKTKKTVKKTTETKKEDTDKKPKKDDLWDDGMEIPDWLKSE